MQQEKSIVTIEKFLKTGAHIGTKFKTGDMMRYIFKQRKDGLKVLDVEGIEARIKIVADFLSRYEQEKIVVVSKKLYGQTPVKMFSEATGARALTGRFVPGTFTNPLAKEFIEPQAVVVTDPDSDTQAVLEATSVKVPVVALCSTNNYLKNVDLIIPINNKGRKSLALAYWMLAKEMLKKKGMIESDEQFSKTVEDFEYKMKAGEEREQEEENEEQGERRRERNPRNRNQRDSRGRGRGRR